MKIVHLLRRFVPHEWGGIESYVLGVSQALTRRNFDVHIFTTSALSKVGTFEFSGISGRRFSYLYPCMPMTKTLQDSMDRKGGNPISFSLFYEILKLPRGSLVHVHTMGRLAAMVRMACLLKNLPYLISLHAGHFCIPEKESRYFKELDKKSFDWGKPFNRIFGTNNILRDAAAVLCFGTDEYLAASRQLPKAKVVYLPHGIEIKKNRTVNGLTFRQRYNLGNAKILLSVGRIDPQKNQLALVKGLPGILQEFPETKLILIGPITVQPYLEEIQVEIKNLGLTEAIQIIPGLPPSSQELTAAYAACNIFVLPSIHEPFGIVVLEAWSFRKPVVISPLPSLQGVVRDGVNGKWSTGHDPSQLSNAILELLRNPQLLNKIGEEGYKTVTKKYTQEGHMNQLCELYHSIMSNRDT